MSLGLLGVLLVGGSGCLNIWSADPVARTNELMVVSEDLRQAKYDWQRIWFLDQPSHLTPQTVHGGIQ